MGVCVTEGTIYVEAAAMDAGAPAMFRFTHATGELRIAFDADRPAEAAAGLTRLFAQLQADGILHLTEPKSDFAAL